MPLVLSSVKVDMLFQIFKSEDAWRPYVVEGTVENWRRISVAVVKAIRGGAAGCVIDKVPFTKSTM
jgi:hypothetical protein